MNQNSFVAPPQSQLHDWENMNRQQTFVPGNNLTYAYISGKVTGLPFNEVVAKFKNKERQLTEQGLMVFNPVERFTIYKKVVIEPSGIKLTEEEEWKVAMRFCLKGLMDASEIHLIDDWQESKGAIEEVRTSLVLGIKIVLP